MDGHDTYRLREMTEAPPTASLPPGPPARQVPGSINLRFVQTFVWVAQLRSFSAAAQKLNVSQAAVSSRINGLEEHLGTALFARNTREVVLTAEGRNLLAPAYELLAAAENMRRAVQAEETLTGTVRLGVVESVVHTWLADYVGTIAERHPRVELEITTESTPRLQDLLKRGFLDLALLTDPAPGPNIRNTGIGTLRLGWVGRADDPDERLEARPVITFARGSQPHLAAVAAFELRGVTPPRMHCVSSLSAVLRLLDAGLGVATLPIDAIRRELATGQYRNIETDDPLPDLPLVASHRTDTGGALHHMLVTAAIEQMARFGAQ